MSEPRSCQATGFAPVAMPLPAVAGGSAASPAGNPHTPPTNGASVGNDIALGVTLAAPHCDWDEGRPLVVAEAARHATSGRAPGWSQTPPALSAVSPQVAERVVAAWVQTAHAEHASVASFSRFNLELMALGAPSELVVASTRAIADEIRHARTAFGVASCFAGHPIAPGELPIDGTMTRSNDPEAVLVAAIVEGCITETVCAMQLQHVVHDVTDPELARQLSCVVDDELRHAELSWAFVRWMLETHPELTEAARDAFASTTLGPAPAVDPDADALARHGVLSEDRKHRVAVDVLAKVIAPCAQALLAA